MIYDCSFRLNERTEERLEAFVSNYKSELKGFAKETDEAVSEDFDFSRDIETAGSDKTLEEFKCKVVYSLIEEIAEAFPTKSIIPSGYFMYPEGGYMKWHTNSNAPFTRLYIVYSEGDNSSFFRYKDVDGKVVTCWDKKGFNYYLFDTPQDDLFWHCVYSGKARRFSFGFRLV